MIESNCVLALVALVLGETLSIYALWIAIHRQPLGIPILSNHACILSVSALLLTGCSIPPLLSLSFEVPSELLWLIRLLIEPLLLYFITFRHVGYLGEMTPPAKCGVQPWMLRLAGASLYVFHSLLTLLYLAGVSVSIPLTLSAGLLFTMNTGLVCIYLYVSDQMGISCARHIRKRSVLGLQLLGWMVGSGVHLCAQGLLLWGHENVSVILLVELSLVWSIVWILMLDAFLAARRLVVKGQEIQELTEPPSIGHDPEPLVSPTQSPLEPPDFLSWIVSCPALEQSQFRDFLQTRHAEEALDLWHAIQEYKDHVSSQDHKAQYESACVLYDTFLDEPKAPKLFSIGDKNRNAIGKRLHDPGIAHSHYLPDAYFLFDGVHLELVPILEKHLCDFFAPRSNESKQDKV
jgi:hypothetical protein